MTWWQENTQNWVNTKQHSLTNENECMCSVLGTEGGGCMCFALGTEGVAVCAFH